MDKCRSLKDFLQFNKRSINIVKDEDIPYIFLRVKRRKNGCKLYWSQNAKPAIPRTRTRGVIPQLNVIGQLIKKNVGLPNKHKEEGSS